MSYSSVNEDILSSSEEAFQTTITFAHKFGETKRKAGYTVVGSTRDTEDLGELLDSIVVKSDITGIKITIGNDLTYGEIVMGQRPELEDLIIDNIDLEPFLITAIKHRLAGKI
jgi:hypothetical protein